MVISKYFRHHIVGSIMFVIKFTLLNKLVIFEKMIFKSKSLFILNNHFMKNIWVENVTLLRLQLASFRGKFVGFDKSVPAGDPEVSRELEELSLKQSFEIRFENWIHIEIAFLVLKIWFKTLFQNEIYFKIY